MMMANNTDSEATDVLRKMFNSNDSSLWTTGFNLRQLNLGNLKSIKESFSSFGTDNKLKVLMSILRLHKRSLDKYKEILEEIINDSIKDSEQWVSIFGEILKTYPSTGCLNSDYSDLSSSNNKANREILVKFMTEAQSEAPTETNYNYLPLECQYLNATALNAVEGLQLQDQPKRHFNLRKQSKADILRAELIQKSRDAQLNSKRTAPVPTIPVRIQRFQKSSPSSNVPSQILTITRTPPTRLSPVGAAGPTAVRPIAAKKAVGPVGVKIIDISELPPAKRKKQPEPNVGGNRAEPVPGSNLMPGLATLPVQDVELPASTSLSPIPIITMPSSTSPVMTTVVTPWNQSQLKTEGQTQPPISPMYVITTPTTSTPRVTTVVFERAQQIFKTASNITQAEKLHIIKFMSGCREHPCPNFGNVITIQLNSEKEQCKTDNGKPICVLVESHFQMDYATGEWSVIKKTSLIDDKPILPANASMPEL